FEGRRLEGSFCSGRSASLVPVATIRRLPGPRDTDLLFAPALEFRLPAAPAPDDQVRQGPEGDLLGGAGRRRTRGAAQRGDACLSPERRRRRDAAARARSFAG